MDNQASSPVTSDKPSVLTSDWRHWLAQDMVRTALMMAIAVSGSLLAGAHIFEALGYEPCALCLDQREAHWTALAIAVAGLAANQVFSAGRLAAAAVGTAALVYGFSSLLAGFHTGVEFGFWPGPASCSGSGTINNISDLSAGFDPSTPRTSCDVVGWRFLGISMAGYNMLFSAGLFALTLIAGGHSLRAARREVHKVS